MDDRKLVITSEQRDKLGSGYQYFYNIPCVKVKGKIKPIHICPRCNGSGNEPTANNDSCDQCIGSGGLS